VPRDILLGETTTRERAHRMLDSVAVGSVSALRVTTVVFLLIPIIFVIAMSMDGRDYLGKFPPPSFSAKWYVRFFTDSFFLNGIRTSILIAVLASLISTAAGLAASIALDRFRFFGRDVIMTALLSPVVVPAIVIGFALLLFSVRLGIYDGFLRLLCGHVIITLPYTVRATLAGLVGIKRSCVEAAQSLGATEWGAFWDIVFPLARTGIVTGAIFAFAFSLDDVAVSLFLSDIHNYTLPVVLISMMRGSFDLSVASAAVVLIGLTLVLIAILDRTVGLERVIGQGIYRN
jgi:putative spermidine/putrescine transport system permease protein